jgi:hypothetical protein
MPSSLIIVALVVAWLLVLVPIVARRRQEVARTADSTLAARVVRSGGVHSTAEEESIMSDSGEADTVRRDFDDDFENLDELDELDDLADVDGIHDVDESEDTEADAAEYYDEYPDDLDYDAHQQARSRPYRPGRGGFDPEAAAATARARYTFRQRVVVLMLTAALITALLAITMSPLMWWAHALIDIGLVAYLGYLRRQVRIEEEIRERRTARLGSPQRTAPAPPAHLDHDAHGPAVDDEVDEAIPEPQLAPRQPLTRYVHPGTVVVDTDDEDPMFAELDDPGALPYRRAVGE